MDDKSAYEDKLKAKLAEWQAEIDKLSAQAREAHADNQIRLQKQVEELRAQREEMESRLREIQSAQTAAWNDIKRGADDAWDTMNKAMREAWSRFS